MRADLHVVKLRKEGPVDHEAYRSPAGRLIDCGRTLLEHLEKGRCSSRIPMHVFLRPAMGDQPGRPGSTRFGLSLL